MATQKTWQVVDEGNPYQREGARRYNSAEGLRWIAEQLDSRFNVFGVRLGWDAILGLIPGFGDIATNIISFYILIQASNLGAPPSVILRMGLNLIVDNLLDTIPLLGNLLDVFWRANNMNVALLERYLENPRRAVVRSRWVVTATLAGVIMVSLACIALTVYVAAMLLQWVFASAHGW